MDQEKISYLRIGSIFSLFFGLLGSIYSISTIVFLLGDLLPLWSLKFFQAAPNNELLLNTLFWSALLLNVILLGIIITFQSLVRDENSGIVNWISIVSIIGVGSSLYQNSIIVKNLSPLISRFKSFPEDLQEAISLIKVFEGDQFILFWLSIGLWFIVVSFLAHNNKLIPKLLIYLGYLLGFSSIINSLSVIINSESLYVISLFLLTILLPLWGFREGFFLRKLYLNAKSSLADTPIDSSSITTPADTSVETSEEPVAAVVEEPVAPVEEETVAPVVEEPVTPVVEEPVAPIVEEPIAPVASS